MIKRYLKGLFYIYKLRQQKEKEAQILINYSILSRRIKNGIRK